VPLVEFGSFSEHVVPHLALIMKIKLNKRVMNMNNLNCITKKSTAYTNLKLKTLSSSILTHGNNCKNGGK